MWQLHIKLNILPYIEPTIPTQGLTQRTKSIQPQNTFWMNVYTGFNWHSSKLEAVSFTSTE